MHFRPRVKRWRSMKEKLPEVNNNCFGFTTEYLQQLSDNKIQHLNN